MTFRKCLNITSRAAQAEAIDTWYDRFAAFCERHPDFDAYYPGAWDAIHLTDEGYLARQRWLVRRGVF